MPPRQNPTHMMQAALAVAHLLDLAQIQYVFDTVRTLLDVARAKSLGYTHRSQVTDNPLLREKQRYSSLSVSDTCTVLGAFLEMAVRSIRQKLEHADHAKYLWGWIWETNTRDLPLSRGAPTLKAVVDELFDTFLPNVVRSVLTNFEGREWKEPEVVAAEANRQAEQSRALAQTAELLQAMMSRGLNAPVMLQDGVAGAVKTHPVVIPAPAAPRVNIEASSSSVDQSNSSNVVSANSGSDQYVPGVHAQMNLSENLNTRYATTTAATVASLNGQTTASTTAAATSSTATAAPAATQVAGHYIPAGKETATDMNSSNTQTASGTASSSLGGNTLSAENIEELEGFLLGGESQMPAGSQMPSSSLANASSVVVEPQSAAAVVVEPKAKGKKGKKGGKKGAGKVNKRQGDGAEKGVEKAAKQGGDELDGV